MVNALDILVMSMLEDKPTGISLAPSARTIRNTRGSKIHYQLGYYWSKRYFNFKDDNPENVRRIHMTMKYIHIRKFCEGWEAGLKERFLLKLIHDE